MDSEQNDAHTFCKKCCRYIRTTNFLIHQTACKGISSMSQSGQTQRIFKNSPSRVNPNSRSQQELAQTIPCHFCGYLQTFAQLDTHPNRCEHRQEQCPRCRQNFPRTLMSQHQIVCPARPEPRFQQQDEEEEIIPRRRLQPHIFHRRQARQPIQFFNLMMMSQLAHERPFEIPRFREPRPERGLFLNNLHQLIQLLAMEGVAQEDKGLSNQEIKQFPITSYKAKQRKQGQQQMCIICYCNFEEDQKCLSLPCKHMFHPECIATWLQKNPSCPLCKLRLKKGNEQEQEREPIEGPFFRIRRF